MRAAARDAFWSWTIGHEGYVLWLYLDVYGLPTTGVGNLLSTPASATALPWRRKDGTPASRDEIIADWAAVKASGCGVYGQFDELPNGRKRIHCAWRGTGKTCMAHQGHRAAESVAKLRLAEADVRSLVMRQLESNERIQAATFEGWETLPADAHLAVHSMAWALGAYWPRKFPRLAAALRARDFLACVDECKLKEDDNPGVVGRNRDVRVLFCNAAHVVSTGGDRDVLHFPKALAPGAVDLNTVLGLQARLSSLGFDPGPVDGVRGPKTDAAVRAFQRARGLDVDGVVGAKTRAALA